MLAGVLNSRVAIEASIHVVRAFVKLRGILASHRELAVKLEAVERRLASHDGALGEQADHIRALFAAVRKLMIPRQKPKKPIGFKPRNI